MKDGVKVNSSIRKDGVGGVLFGDTMRVVDTQTHEKEGEGVEGNKAQRLERMFADRNLYVWRRRR